MIRQSWSFASFFAILTVSSAQSQFSSDFTTYHSAFATISVRRGADDWSSTRKHGFSHASEIAPMTRLNSLSFPMAADGQGEVTSDHGFNMRAIASINGNVTVRLHVMFHPTELAEIKPGQYTDVANNSPISDSFNHFFSPHADRQPIIVRNDVFGFALGKKAIDDILFQMGDDESPTIVSVVGGANLLPMGEKPLSMLPEKVEVDKPPLSAREMIVLVAACLLIGGITHFTGPICRQLAMAVKEVHYAV